MKNSALIILFSAISLASISVAHAESIGGGAPAQMVPPESIGGGSPQSVAPPESIGGGASATAEAPPESIGGGDAIWAWFETFFLI